MCGPANRAQTSEQGRAGLIPSSSQELVIVVVMEFIPVSLVTIV